MGKNTPQRQDFIIGNLKVEKDLVEDEGGVLWRPSRTSWKRTKWRHDAFGGSRGVDDPLGRVGLGTAHGYGTPLRGPRERLFLRAGWQVPHAGAGVDAQRRAAPPSRFWAPQRAMVDTTFNVIRDSLSVLMVRLPYSVEYVAIHAGACAVPKGEFPHAFHSGRRYAGSWHLVGYPVRQLSLGVQRSERAERQLCGPFRSPTDHGAQARADPGSTGRAGPAAHLVSLLPQDSSRRVW